MALRIVSSSLPRGEVGRPYAFTLRAAGGTGDYRWTIDPLPAGLTLDRASGAIGGRPTEPAASSVLLQVKDNGTGQKASAFLMLAIAAPPLAIATTAFADGVAGEPYSAQLAANGGTPAYRWTAGGLPAGLACTVSGAISGTPTAAFAGPIALAATDASRPPQSASASLALSIAAPLAIVTTSLPGGFVPISYSAQLAASGGTPPYRWTAAGLPAGLACSTSGAISGEPTATFNGAVGVTVSDASRVLQSVSASLGLRIVPMLAITTTALQPGVVGQLYSAQLGARGGSLPYSWTVAGGSLPPGLACSPSGAIAGTPTTRGVWAFSVSVTDSWNVSTSVALTVDVAAAAGWTDVLTGLTVGSAAVGRAGAGFVAVSSYQTVPLATWTSGDGRSWTAVSADGYKMNELVLISGDRMSWLLGMADSRTLIFAFDPSGSTWRQVGITPPFTLYWGLAGAWFNGLLWIFGGFQAQQPCTNQIWTSPDGAIWTQRAAPPWAPRAYAGAAAFDGKLWVCGGYGSNFQVAPSYVNDIWSSPDGAAWTQGPGVPWAGSAGVACIALAPTGDRLYALTSSGDWRSQSLPLSMWAMRKDGSWLPAGPVGLLQNNLKRVGLAGFGGLLLAAGGLEQKMRLCTPSPADDA